MRALLSNLGTLGDLQPFLALGVELARHGHEATIASSPYFKSLVESRGLQFCPIGSDIRPDIFEINVAIIASPELSYSSQALQQIGQPLVKELLPVYHELLRLSAKADVLVCGQMQPAGRMVHESTGIPFVSVQVTNLGSRGTTAYRHATEALINPVRKELGLPAIKDPLTAGSDSSELSLYAFSRHVRPRQRDWPPHFHVTGYFFLDDPGWLPNPQLQEFINDGDPPVAITFGSNMVRDGGQIAEVVVGAMRLTGRRFILQQGWTGLKVPIGCADALSVQYVPHQWLFPRCRCVIHHGGAGTTASVFRSGTPSVFVPHAFDQFLWSELAFDLKCSPRPIAFSGLTEESLAAAVTEATGNHSYSFRARRLAAVIATEDGCGNARLLIEELVRARIRAFTGTDLAKNRLSGRAAQLSILRLRRRASVPDRGMRRSDS